MDPSVQPQVPPPVTPPTDTTTVAANALANPVVQAATQIPSPPAVASAGAKEAGPVSVEPVVPIEVVGTDAIEKEPLPLEVASWMEKVNRDTSGEKPPEVVVADHTAQDPVGSYANQPVFVLPLGEPEYSKAMHQSVNDSIRWLAAWCSRIMKKLHGQTVFSHN